MIRAIFFKEWREHRPKYLGYWFTLNVPMLLLALGVAFTNVGRVPFSDLSNAMAMKYLPISLAESFLVVTIFLILTGYLAVATFSPEIEDHSVFFMFEQPLSRKRYVTIKLLNGAGQVILATCFSILLFPVVSYVMMLLSGKVTWAGSSDAFGLVMAVALRVAIWCSLVSAVAFTASALISALVPWWWLAALCSVVLSVVSIGWGNTLFFPDLFPDTTGGESQSVTVNFGTGHAQWVQIGRAFKPAELDAVAPWHVWPLPVLIVVLLIAVFCVATVLLYERKELK